MVDSNPTLHIYRVRDKHGNVRVVHRNLLFQANFLPFPECHSEVGAAVSGGAAHSDSLSVVGSDVASEADSSVPVPGSTCVDSLTDFAILADDCTSACGLSFYC